MSRLPTEKETMMTFMHKEKIETTMASRKGPKESRKVSQPGQPYSAQSFRVQPSSPSYPH